MIEVVISCDLTENVINTGMSFKSSSETDKALDLREITRNYVECLRSIDLMLKGSIDTQMLAMSIQLELMGTRLNNLASSLNGTRVKRQRELARVCVVLAEELATESNRHDKS